MKVLCLSHDKPSFSPNWEIIHLPLIAFRVTPLEIRKEYLKNFSLFTHILITSRQIPSLLKQTVTSLQIPASEYQKKQYIAVGPSTACVLKEEMKVVAQIPNPYSQEGLISLLEKQDLGKACFFYPKAKTTRPLLEAFFQKKKIPLHTGIFYETLVVEEIEVSFSFEEVEAIYFSSPSVVDAFFYHFGKVPEGKKIWVVGEVTRKAFLEYYPSSCVEKIFS